MARYRSDGSLQFIGRVDSQVKLRGFRIELEEIETVLLEHTGVREAVVLVREDVPEDRRLIAYVVSDQERKLSRDDLKTHARKRLPEYMVPSAFVIMSALPLTANGKINRRMLPVPEQPLETTYVAPQTELEHYIASVWQEVLHLEQVSTHENFFDLGGHSLLLAQVLRSLRAALKADLSMIALFQYPTIGSLAKYMMQEPAEEHTPQDDDRFKVHKSSRRQRSQVRQAAWKNENNMRGAE